MVLGDLDGSQLSGLRSPYPATVRCLVRSWALESHGTALSPWGFSLPAASLLFPAWGLLRNPASTSQHFLPKLESPSFSFAPQKQKNH